MIHQFFGLREQPFGVTPDPRYLYLGPGHREALASLFCGIEANRGFLALIAQPGMGKTTLLFHLLEKFRHSARTAFLFQTQCSSRELLRFLLAEFGIESKENDLVRMHERVNRYLTEQSVAGNRVIVVIDEAQNLEPSVLETVRLLSNFETPRAKLLQIILAGQPELATKLASPSLSQLRQRIASFNGLDPLAPQEVARFIDHRLHVAHYQGPPLFSDKAKAMIAGLSEGIPRNINSLCFGTLSLACALRQKTIDTEIVHEVFGDLDLQKLFPHSQRVAIPHHSTTWSSQLADPKLASLSQALLSPSEARLTPTGVVALSGTRSGLDGANHDGDMTSAPANYEAPRPILRKSVYSLSLRVVGLAVLAVLAFMVGVEIRLAAPVVKIANSWPRPNSENVAPPSIVKISDTEAVRLAPAKTQPEQVQNPAVDPAELWKRVQEGSTSAEIRLAAPVVKIANSRPRPNSENVAPPSIVKIPDTEAVRLAPAKTQPEQVQNPTVDPAELWKRVQEVSTSAEIELAAPVVEIANTWRRPNPENRADAGDSIAQYEMALRYADGDGVPQNYRDAMAWFAKAAANGNDNAQWKLGLGYIKGIGVPHDERKAVVWFKRAANHGDIRAQSALSDLYLSGRGVPRDYVRAYTWASIATGLPGSDNDRLRAIGSRMTAAQIEDAHRRISSWRERVAPPSNVKLSDPEAVRLAPAKTQPEQVQNPTVDPAELWERVKKRSSSAEIGLATLYLEGSVVEQNCEQAHLLLVAASRNGSKVASGLLNGEYAERCH